MRAKIKFRDRRALRASRIPPWVARGERVAHAYAQRLPEGFTGKFGTEGHGGVSCTAKINVGVGSGGSGVRVLSSCQVECFRVAVG